MDGLINAISSPSVLRALLGLTFTGFSTFAGIVMKKVFSAAKAKVKEFEDSIVGIKLQMNAAVTNHLKHIQDSTTETNVILREMAKSQSELNGYLKAKAEDGKI